MHPRTPLIMAVLSFALPAAAQFSVKEIDAAKNDPKSYTIDEASIEIMKVESPAAPMRAIPPGGEVKSAAALDQIINVGQKIWKIVADNKPVVDVHTQYATALPDGMKGWTSMEGWQRPQGTIYRLTAKNAYGAQVINLRYQVLRTAGGSWNGAGKYLTAVTVEPLLIEVAWGYHLSMEAAVPDTSIVNVGTNAHPIAAMTAQLGWRISTAVKDSQGKGLYYLQGDGAYQEIGGPFRRVGVDRIKASIAKTLSETLPSGL